MNESSESVSVEQRLISLETRLASVELRLRNTESLITDLQNGLINGTIAISTMTNVLVEKKLVEIKELQQTSEKINNELANEYKNWAESQKQEGESPKEV